jgi:hypothetical protein
MVSEVVVSTSDMPSAVISIIAIKATITAMPSSRLTRVVIVRDSGSEA